MNTTELTLGGRTGTIIQVDASADLDTMYHLVHEELRERIGNEARHALFVLVVFGRTPASPSEECLTLPGWYPVHDRRKIQNASDWHHHHAVVIHCPHQEEIVIPTGISTDDLVYEGRKKSNVYSKLVGTMEREELLRLNDSIELFRPDTIQPSGYSLIIPAGETHAKLTAPEGFSGAGGTVQRRNWYGSDREERA